MHQKNEYDNSAPGDRLDIVIDKLDYIIRLLRKMKEMDMSRYTDLRDRLRANRSQGNALRDLLKTLNAGTEAEYQELLAEIQADADAVAADIVANTPTAPNPDVPSGSAGNVPNEPTS